MSAPRRHLGLKRVVTVQTKQENVGELCEEKWAKQSTFPSSLLLAPSSLMGKSLLCPDID